MRPQVNVAIRPTTQILLTDMCATVDLDVPPSIASAVESPALTPRTIVMGPQVNVAIRPTAQVLLPSFRTACDLDVVHPRFARHICYPPPLPPRSVIATPQIDEPIMSYTQILLSRVCASGIHDDVPAPIEVPEQCFRQVCRHRNVRSPVSGLFARRLARSAKAPNPSAWRTSRRG